MRIFFITVLVAFSVGSIILAQPRETADFNHRGEAMAGCDATIDGEGNALDIYDISDGNNPAASHHNEGYGLFGGSSVAPIGSRSIWLFGRSSIPDHPQITATTAPGIGLTVSGV